MKKAIAIALVIGIILVAYSNTTKSITSESEVKSKVKEQDETKQYKYTSAEPFASLAIGLWTVSLISYLASPTRGVTWDVYFLFVLGVISALLSVYLILPWNWKQESVLESLKRDKTVNIVKLIAWAIVIVVFGFRLVQTGIIWLFLTGLLTMFMALIVLFVGLFRMDGNKRKYKHT